MDIKHVLSRNPLQPAYAGAPTEPAETDALGWVEVDGGLVEIGHEGGAGDSGFCFDNELPRHEQWLRPFRIADRLVTNGEWLEFMADGGYRRHELWLSDGWAKIQNEGWAGAVLLDRGRRRLVRAHAQRHLAGQPGPAGQPHQLLRGGGLRDLGRQATAERGGVGARRPQRRTVTGNLANSTSWHPEAAPTAGPGTGGLRQMFGDCWEWTSSAYHPYPGFRPPAGAIGEYNGKFMSNQMVLRGGCALTPAGHARASYRNFFPHQSRWALSGVRLADDGAAA